MGWLLSAPLRGWVLLAAAASLLLNLALIVPALYMLQVFDRVFASRSVETLVMLALFTLLALGLAFCMDRARSLLLARAGRCIDETLAAPALVASLGGAARGREDATQGALPDIARLRHFLSGPAVQALFDAPWLPVYLLAIHALHPALGAAALVSAGLLFVLGVIAEGHARADGTALLEGRQQAGRHLDALHRQAEVLLGMGMLRRAVEGWQAMQQRLHGLQDGLDATGASLAALGRALRQGVQAGMLTLGAWLVIDGHASPGIMIAATLLVGRALQPVEQLIAGWRALVEVRAAWARLQQPLPDGARPAASSAQAPGETPMRLPALRGALSLEGLHYRADPQRPPLIRQLSLDVPAGTCLGLIGGSGAGKTTLLRLMLGLRHPQSGSVRLDGIALENWPQDQLEGAIGYLPQDVSLFAGSVAQNIARLGPVDSAAVLAAAQLAGVHGLVSRLPQAYETELGEAGARLSGGQRQRLGLARAVYGDPKLVVLDEPNAHLDSEGEDALGAAIAALKQRGTTVVIVSHRPALMRHADQLAVLRDGTLEMAGPRDAVLARLHGATVHALRRTPTPAPSSAQPSPATAAATDATDDVQAEHPASRQASAGASRMSAIAHPGRAHGGDLQAAASAAAGRSTGAGPAPTSLALLLAQAAPVGSQRTAQRRLRRAVLVPLAVAALLMAGWSAWAPLSGAVVASGQVQAALGRKPVQHQEGGLLREVLVQPGQAVRRGDPLMVIGDLRSDATLALLRGQAEAEALRAARSQAELALAAGFEPPAGLAPAPAVLAREQALFDARRRSLQEQLAAMQSQSREAQSRIAALQSQLLASERAVSLSGDELAMNAELVAAGFIQKSRLLAVERGVAETRVRAESVRGQIAEAQMQVSSLANAMAQARGAYQQRAAEDLKEAGARLREIEERLRPSQDQVDRQTVRAPVDGTVMALRVSAPGSTVAPRETLLEIAPSDERLVIELRIDPHDIEHVRPGDAAEVLLSAFEARSTPLLQAVVTSVSPDAMTEPNGRGTWFSAQVTVQADDLAAHPHLRLQAGMPAEVFVTTPPRSLLRYLLEPVGVFARRALREP